MKDWATKAIAAFSLFVFLANCHTFAQTEQNRQWVDRHFNEVLEKLLPIEERLGESLGVRSFRDLYTDELEYGILFNWSWQEKTVNVVYRIADGKSIYDQMLELHAKQPNKGIDELMKLVKIKEWRSKHSTMASLKDEFYSFGLPMLSEKDRKNQQEGKIEITLHPRIYKFEANISGGYLSLTLNDSSHQFALWVEKAKRTIESLMTTEQNQRRRQ